MKKSLVLFLVAASLFLAGCDTDKLPAPKEIDTILVSDTIQYHPVRINKYDGSILPWYSSDAGASYDTTLMLVWNFWNNMETDSNGLKYYMNHQVWRTYEHDMTRTGRGPDQYGIVIVGTSLCLYRQ